MAKFQKLFEVFKAEASNVERSTKSRNGHIAAVRSGRYTFPVKQGYLKSDVPGVHKPDPLRFSLLQLGMNKIIYDRFTPADMVRFLKKEHYKTPTGKDPDINHLMRILRDSYYCGIIKVKDYEPSIGLHKPMIKPEEFDQLQEIINGRRIKYVRKKKNPAFPLNVFVTCAHCGNEAKFVGFNHNNGKGWIKPKYRCRICNKQYHVDLVHEAINQSLNRFSLDSSSRAFFIEALKKVWLESQEDNVTHISNLEQQLIKLKSLKMDLTDQWALAAAEIKPDIQESIDRKKDEISELEKELEDAKNIDKDLLEFTKFALGFVNNMQESFWGLEPEDKIKCKQLIFKGQFSVDYDLKVFTPEISPIFSTILHKKDPSVSDESLLVELRGVAPLSKPVPAINLHK